MPANDLPQAKFSLTNIAAVLAVLALHGLATWGLANAASPNFPEPKIDDITPIEIQLVTPMEEKPPEVVEIEKVEPTPIKSMSESKPVVAPEPKPKPVLAPKPDPKPKPKPKPKPVVEPKPTPKLKSKPKVVQDSSTVTDNSFALEKQRQAELDKQHQIELNKQHQAELDQQRKAELDTQRQANLDKQRQADLEKQHQTDLEKQRQADLDKQRQADLDKQRQVDLEKQRQAELDKQRQAEIEKQRQAASNTPVNFSEQQANWRQPPNFRPLERLRHGADPGQLLTLIITITVDKQGNVTNVVKNKLSGNTAIDNGVVRAVKASKLKPFLQNGVAVIGTLTIPIAYQVPKR